MKVSYEHLVLKNASIKNPKRTSKGLDIVSNNVLNEYKNDTKTSDSLWFTSDFAQDHLLFIALKYGIITYTR